MLAHPAKPYAERPHYRPFLAGPPRFAVNLSPIPESLWLRPDPEHAANLANRAEVLAAGYADAVRWDAESAAAQADARGMIEAALGESAPDAPFGVAEAPDIVRAGALLADDMALMEPREDGWTATAMILTAPTFFSAEGSHGFALPTLHRPVPGGDPELAGRIGRIFDHLGDAPLQRFNWTLQCGDARNAPDGEADRALAATLGPDAAARALTLRTERQTIRRLPQTGAVLFTIRVLMDPVDTLTPELKSALARSWRTATPEARAYKNWAKLDAAVEIAFAGF